LDIDRIYGVSLEVFDDPEAMLERAVKLTADGKMVLVIDHESDRRVQVVVVDDEQLSG
jgi:hypothetical protein